MGSWIRRHRRYFPFAIAIVTLLLLRPRPWGDPVDGLSIVTAILLCVLGQALRFWTWGSNAIAGESEIRDRGPYVLMRHPLYSGNLLIFAGLAVVYNNVLVYSLLLPSFAFVYHMTARWEESYLRENRGVDYQRYDLKALPRFRPALHNLGCAVETTVPFNSRFAWRKEYPSCCAWIAGIAGLQSYKELVAQGWTWSWPDNWASVVVMGICGTIMLLTVRVRKCKTKGSDLEPVGS